MRFRRITHLRILPCAVPVFMAAGLAYMAWNHPSEQELTDTASLSPTEHEASRPKRSPLLSDHSPDITQQGNIGVPAADVLPVSVPQSRKLQELVRSFEGKQVTMSVEDMAPVTSRQTGESVSFSLAGMAWSGKVLSRSEDAGILRMAVELDEGAGSCVINLRADQTLWASVLFNGESQAIALRGKPVNGQWTASLVSLDKVLCTPVGGTFPPRRGLSSMPRAEAKTGGSAGGGRIAKAPDLNSNPDSPYVFYIDFDGEIVSNPEWTALTNGQTINAAPHPRAGDDGFVTRIWERVVEDFAPFNVNVTTQRSVFDQATPDRRMMCIVTPTDDVVPGSGGVAYLESFGSDIPCWCFNPTEDTAADTVSHEIGHTLGLRHDGQVNGFEYYGGQGTGAVSWAPIMGAFFADFEPPFVDDELTQWSKGEYPDASNQEDDLAIIAGTRNRFGYRNDDHGDAREISTYVQSTESEVSIPGIIERTEDQDWFSIPTSGGLVDLKINAVDVASPEHDQRGANLAISAVLYDDRGNKVAESNQADEIDSSISVRLRAGNYFLRVEGAGRGDLTTGFSDYASLGQYTIKGTLPQEDVVTLDPTSATFSRDGGRGTFLVTKAENWTWSTDASWVKSSLTPNQTGSRNFVYTVDRNASRNTRKAQITIQSGPFSATHVITQNGPLDDDHGDIFEEATTVDQNSSTAGNLEESGDIDMFRIDVQGFGWLTVSASGATDTIGDFYDGNGFRLGTDDESLSPNFQMTRKVSTGTYYVAVRHAVDGGTGKYLFNTSFRPGSALLISPRKRQVGPSGGNFLVDVVSSRPWTWSATASWLALQPTGSQLGGTRLAYRVLPNNSNRSRTATIEFRNGRNRVVHTITQSPAREDDHSDTLNKASELAANGTQQGRIQFEGDADLFRIRLATSGFLSLVANGPTDTVAELLDSEGKLMLRVDEGNGDNFLLRSEMNAGIYYLRVIAYGGVKVGPYSVRSTYLPSELINVSYRASKGGGIRGPAFQSVRLGADAVPVVAVPQAGYSFLRWTDGESGLKRSDLNLLSHVNVSAEFIPTLSVTYPGGVVLPARLRPVDFGILSRGQNKNIEFRIRNQGSSTLSNLTVSPRGLPADAWSVSNPGKSILAAGQSTTVRITLRGDTAGYHNTQWIVRAKGMNRSFIIRTMGVVGGPLANKAFAPIVAAQTPVAPSPDTSLPWIELSPDGFFRYRFDRAVDDLSEQTFWISADGVDWEEALVLDVWKTRAGTETNHFEAILAPPQDPAPRIVVMESAPDLKVTE